MSSNRRAYLTNQWKKGLPIFRPERERPRSKAEQKAIDEALGHLTPYRYHAEDHRELVADKWRRKAANDLAARLRRTYSLRDFMAEDGQLRLAAYNVVPMPVGWSRDTVEEAARQVLPPRRGWSAELVQNLALLAIISCSDWQAQREEFLRAVFWLGWRLQCDQSVVLGMICRTRNWMFSHSTHEIAVLARAQLPDGLFAPGALARLRSHARGATTERCRAAAAEALPAKSRTDEELVATLAVITKLDRAYRPVRAACAELRRRALHALARRLGTSVRTARDAAWRAARLLQLAAEAPPADRVPPRRLRMCRPPRKRR